MGSLAGFIDQQSALGIPTSSGAQTTGIPIEGVELDKE